MEWSWRTVLILLGLLLVAGVMIDGFRRMRRARADALRFDLGKDNFSDDLYVNPELPQPYRVVDYEPKAEIKQQDFDPIFDEQETDTDTEPPQAFDYTKHNESAEEHQLESADPEFEDQSDTHIDSQVDEEVEEVEEVEQPTPARLAVRPVNLDEDFPVLLDVEELGKEDESLPQEPLEKITESGLDFHEVSADPFAELAMNEVMEAPNAEASLKSLKQSFEEKGDEDAIYTEEALAVNEAVTSTTQDDQETKQESSETDPEASQNTSTHVDVSDDSNVSTSEEESKAAPRLAPLLYASAEAEKLSERAEAQMALVIHCISRDELGFTGEDMVNLFNQCDVRFGEREIFHRFEQAEGKGSIQFSIVHSFEPRHFSPETILDQHFRGLSLFMKLPGAKNPSAAYEAMVAIAQLLAKHFNADLFDGERSALTQQTIEHERQQIVDFEYRQKVAAKKQALS